MTCYVNLRRVVRPMLHERTQKKITIVSSDRKKIAAALLESISPENLPSQYGGTCAVKLGESQEEENLRAYVASITPSSEPRQMKEEDQEVEIDLHAKGVETRVEGDVPGEGDPDGGTDEDDDEDRSNATSNRMFNKMGGAFRWAGAKLSWRRVPVAHLGEENGYEYDADQQRWILREEVDGVGGGGARSGNGGGNRKAKAKARTIAGVEKERASVLNVERSGSSTGSSSSEEMTVLAIQVGTYNDPRDGLTLTRWMFLMLWFHAFIKIMLHRFLRRFTKESIRWLEPFSCVLSPAS